MTRVINARRSCGFQLFELNLAFVWWQRSARGALEPYGWHIEFNDLDAWNGAQQVFRGFNHASNTRMLVQRHAHWHGLAQVWSQLVEFPAQETDELPAIHGCVDDGPSQSFGH